MAGIRDHDDRIPQAVDALRGIAEVVPVLAAVTDTLHRSGDRQKLTQARVPRRRRLRLGLDLRSSSKRSSRPVRHSTAALGWQVPAAQHRYLAAVSTRLGCPAIFVGGTADHVHCLARQGRTITVADWVTELKRTSSRQAKTQAASLHGFQWQAGYGAFSVSPSLSRTVQRYIDRQPDHHQRDDFQTEFRTLLQTHGLEYDERYVWD